MPVLVVNRVFNSDISFNKECFFVYAENEKKEGGETFKRGNEHDLNNIINVLKYGACVFIEQNFLASESNSPMNTECPKTKEFLLEGIQLLHSRYRPFRVKT